MHNRMKNYGIVLVELLFVYEHRQMDHVLGFVETERAEIIWITNLQQVRYPMCLITEDIIKYLTIIECI